MVGRGKYLCRWLFRCTASSGRTYRARAPDGVYFAAWDRVWSLAGTGQVEIWILCLDFTTWHIDSLP